MKKTIILSIVAMMAATSCLNLDFYPHNAISRYDVNEDDIQLFYYGLYNCSQYKPTLNGYFFDDIIGGDLVRAGGSSAGMGARDLIEGLVMPTGFVGGVWNGYYAWLYQVNCFIISANALPASSDKDKYLGTGYFFRGLIYYNLTAKWREVPIVDTPTNESLPKSSEAECWAYTEDNLRKAADLLGDFGGDNTFVSRQAAQALLARTLLAQGKLDAAAKCAETVITSGFFSLDSYDNIWSGATNKEVIFCYANTGAEENGLVMSSYFRGAPNYVPTSAFESQVVTSDERYPYLSYADGVYTTLNKYNTYGGYDPIVVCRLSEMYLISAEGKGRKDGVARLNDLRAKRGLAPHGVFTNDDSFIDAILAERRLELVQEGFRWFDLVRTGRYSTLMGLDPKYMVMPLPSAQVERSNGKLIQHTLWAAESSN